MSTQLPPPPPPVSKKSRLSKILKDSVGLVGDVVSAPVSVVGSKIEEVRDLNAARRLTKPMREQQRAVVRKLGHDYRTQQAEQKATEKAQADEMQRYEDELPGFIA